MPTEHPATPAATPNDPVPDQDAHPYSQPEPHLEPDADQDAPDQTAVQAELPPEHAAADDLDATAEHFLRPTPTADDLDRLIVLIRAANDAFERLNNAVLALNISVGQFAALRQHVNRGAGPRVAYNPTGIHRKRKRG